jgi:hypothetical protein
MGDFLPCKIKRFHRIIIWLWNNLHYSQSREKIHYGCVPGQVGLSVHFLSLRRILFLILKSFHSTPTHQSLSWALWNETCKQQNQPESLHPQTSTPIVASPAEDCGGAQNWSLKDRREAVDLSCFDHWNISWLCWTQVSNTSFFFYVLFSRLPVTGRCKKISHYKCVWSDRSDFICFHQLLFSIYLKPQQMPVSWWFSWEILYIVMAVIHRSIKIKPKTLTVLIALKSGKLKGLLWAMLFVTCFHQCLHQG